MPCNPHISIITPVYNVSCDCLSELIHSVLNQTFRSFEWILIDDGSDDTRILKLLDRLEQENGNVKVIHHTTNRGLPAARNTGIKHSCSPYLFFVDGDDLIDATFLEKAFLFLELNNEFAFVNSYVAGFGSMEYRWTGGFHENELFLKENRNTSCFLARREAFQKVMFDEALRDGGEDWDFWLHSASKGLWGYTIPEYLFFYRRSAESKWSSLKNEASLKQLQQEIVARYASVLENSFPRPVLQDFSMRVNVPELDLAAKAETREKHLVCIFPWLEVGGADQFNLNLLTGLKDKGWTITILTTEGTNHPWEDKFRSITHDVFHLASLSTSFAFSSLISYVIQSRHPRLVFLSNSMYGYKLLPYIKQKFPSLPVMDFLHCEDVSWYNGGYPFLSTLYTNYLDKTFTTSKQLRDWCIAAGAESQKVEVCYINVDVNKFRRRVDIREKVRQELNLTDQTPLLLYVARLTEQKQPKVLVQTLVELKARMVPFKCVVIGDGPDRELLLGLIRKCRLSDEVLYLGMQPNEVVMQYMDAGDVFFLPSLYEGIALSIFEAMAKGLAVVGADVGGQAELVTKDCGFLIKPGGFDNEVRDYVAQLSNLLANGQEIQRLGENARHRVVANFDLNKMIGQMHDSFISQKCARALNLEALQQSYLLLLNQAISLEKSNERLTRKLNTKPIKLLSKLERPYYRLETHFKKLKQVLKK